MPTTPPKETDVGQITVYPINGDDDGWKVITVVFRGDVKQVLSDSVYEALTVQQKMEPQR